MVLPILTIYREVRQAEGHDRDPTTAIIDSQVVKTTRVGGPERGYDEAPRGTETSHLWLGDITCVPTREGFLHLAFLLDTHSHRIVGWSMDFHMRTELVVDALEMAVWGRKPSTGLVHHSDRGAQYTAISFGRRLEEVDIVPSMGRTGTVLDDAMAESFIASLKAELVHRRRFPIER